MALFSAALSRRAVGGSSIASSRGSARAAAAAAAVAPTKPRISAPIAARSSVPAQQRAAATTTSTKALPVEVAQLADEGGFIGGVALTMTAITLLGLAVGFVLLRVEGLVEEGKL